MDEQEQSDETEDQINNKSFSPNLDEEAEETADACIT